MKSMKALAALALALAMALALVACGGGASSSSSSSASGVSSSASAPSASSSSAVSENATGQAPSEAYVFTKIDMKYRDGSTMAKSFTFDDRGRQQTLSLDMVSSAATYDVDATFTDWDEYGHPMKAVETGDYGDGRPFTTTTEVVARELNADGSIASFTEVNTLDKASFEEGEFASSKVTSALEYGGDVQVCRRQETKTEYFDKSGALLVTQTQTNEFDEGGLQTHCALKTVNADGTQLNETADITWTKDADGKPVSYTIVLSQDGADAATTTTTGDVKTDESGLISWIGNVKANGEALATEVTIEHVKISDPLPNAYEGWKSFALSDVLLQRA